MPKVSLSLADEADVVFTDTALLVSDLNVHRCDCDADRWQAYSRCH